MPTYEYTCRDCGYTFEIVQSMLDEPLTMCPECGGSLRKVFAPPAISFKGSGFYATDHGKKAKAGRGDNRQARRSRDGRRVVVGRIEGVEGCRDEGREGTSESSSSSAKKEPAPS